MNDGIRSRSRTSQVARAWRIRSRFAVRCSRMAVKSLRTSRPCDSALKSVWPAPFSAPVTRHSSPAYSPEGVRGHGHLPQRVICTNPPIQINLIAEEFLLLLLLAHHNGIQTKPTASRSINRQKMIWATRPLAEMEASATAEWTRSFTALVAPKSDEGGKA